MSVRRESDGRRLAMRWQTQVSGGRLLLGLSLMAGGLAPASVLAQRADPYNGTGDYNGGYVPYINPVYPDGWTFTPGEGYLSGPTGVRRANQYQRYIEDLDGAGMGDTGGYGGGTTR